MDNERLEILIELTERSLLSELKLYSVNAGDPVRVQHMPSGWELLGAGNYAAVFAHRQHEDIAVKVYAPNREGWDDEKDVYFHLGDHHSYSTCYYASVYEGHSYLLLRRLRGKTMYQCLLEGTKIPENIITDIDQALDYARERGLNPHDVHGKNVMVSSEGRGIVLDVSDFLKQEPCLMWDDLKGAYNRIYKPFLSRYPIAIPKWMMNGVRKVYRWHRSSENGSS